MCETAFASLGGLCGGVLSRTSWRRPCWRSSAAMFVAAVRSSCREEVGWFRVQGLGCLVPGRPNVGQVAVFSLHDPQPTKASVRVQGFTLLNSRNLGRSPPKYSRSSLSEHIPTFRYGLPVAPAACSIDSRLGAACGSSQPLYETCPMYHTVSNLLQLLEGGVVVLVVAEFCCL